MSKHPFPILLAVSVFLACAMTSSFLLRGRSTTEEDALSLLLRSSGAARVFLVDLLWLRMHAHLGEGNESLVLSDARTLLSLEDRSPRVRTFLHWHLAINMARKAVTESSRAHWIREGLEVMEEGLRKDPDSYILNREMGLTFFVRSGAYETFRRVCRERYENDEHVYPEQRAPLFLEKAFRMRRDRDTLLFLLPALVNAAHFETERESFIKAHELWNKVFEYLEPGLQTMEEAQAALDYYENLRSYCALMMQMEKGEELGPKDVKKARDLKQRIKESEFCEIWDDSDSK